jgi:hypothetical protein
MKIGWIPGQTATSHEIASRVGPCARVCLIVPPKAPGCFNTKNIKHVLSIALAFRSFQLSSSFVSEVVLGFHNFSTFQRISNTLHHQVEPARALA